jgi:hypothetical protein
MATSKGQAMKWTVQAAGSCAIISKRQALKYYLDNDPLLLCLPRFPGEAKGYKFGVFLLYLVLFYAIHVGM